MNAEIPRRTHAKAAAWRAQALGTSDAGNHLGISVKVGGITEKWLPLPRFSNLQSQSGVGLLDGGLVDIADGDPGAQTLQNSGSSQADSAGPTRDGS
jgi:hypothetical protein